jgi:hypothetical protein
LTMSSCSFSRRACRSDFDSTPFAASASFIFPSSPFLTTRLAYIHKKSTTMIMGSTFIIKVVTETRTPTLNNISGSPAFINKNGGDACNGGFISSTACYDMVVIHSTMCRCAAGKKRSRWMKARVHSKEKAR